MIPALSSAGALTATQVTDVLRTAAGPAWWGDPCWRIDGTAAGFELRVDSSVWPPRPDPRPDHSEVVRARQVRIAAGAALLNMRVAVRALGVSAVVKLLPYPARPDVLWALRTHDRMPATATDLDLVRAPTPPILTDRRWSDLAVEPVSTALRRAARTEGVWLATIGPHQQLRFDEMATAVTPPHQLVAVVGTLDDAPLSQLQAGQGVQRVLLTAVALGCRCDLSPGLVEEETSRQLLRELLGGAVWPQMVVRVDYGES